MKNAKEELLRILACTQFLASGGVYIKCANVHSGFYVADYVAEEDKFTCQLKVGHSKEDLKVFIGSLDFYYEPSGVQHLFGYVWLTDGSWLSRQECGGNEWWERTVIPTIPQELL